MQVSLLGGRPSGPGRCWSCWERQWGMQARWFGSAGHDGWPPLRALAFVACQVTLPGYNTSLSGARSPSPLCLTWKPCHQLRPPPPLAPQVRREARQHAYSKALGETMHSGEQAAIQSCLELLRQADSMEVRFCVAAWCCLDSLAAGQADLGGKAAAGWGWLGRDGRAAGGLLHTGCLAAGPEQSLHPAPTQHSAMRHPPSRS